MTALTKEFQDYMHGYAAFPPARIGDDGEPVSLAEILETPNEDRRLPVNNTEPRVLMSKQKYALILERDGRACRYCYAGGHRIEIDHIVPRSVFPPHLLHIADRSDNLTPACVSCNSTKSNYDYGDTKRPGVTPACWECLNPAPDAEDYPEEYADWSELAAPNRVHLVFCGRCGMGGHVPDLGWVL